MISYLIINFLFHWLICLSLPSHFQISQDYLSRDISHIFIHVGRFLLQSLSLEGFFFLLLNSVCLFFSFISVWMMASASNIPWYFSFYPSVLILFRFLSHILFRCFSFPHFHFAQSTLAVDYTDSYSADG